MTRSLTLVGLVLGLLAVQAPAEAADCGVTQNEWQAVHADDTSRDNQTKGIVHSIFGFNGQQVVQGDGFETRKYKTCGSWNDGWHVYVQYDYHADGAYGEGWYVERKYGA